MDHLLITLLSAVLVVAACVLHYEVLLRVSALIPMLTIPPRRRTLVVVAAVMIAHMLQIGLYALGYWVGINLLGLGALTGTLEGNGFDYFYFSATIVHDARRGRSDAGRPPADHGRDPVAERSRADHLVCVVHLYLDGEILAGSAVIQWIGVAPVGDVRREATP